MLHWRRFEGSPVQTACKPLDFTPYASSTKTPPVQPGELQLEMRSLHAKYPQRELLLHSQPSTLIVVLADVASQF